MRGPDRPLTKYCKHVALTLKLSSEGWVQIPITYPGTIVGVRWSSVCSYASTDETEKSIYAVWCGLYHSESTSDKPTGIMNALSYPANVFLALGDESKNMAQWVHIVKDNGIQSSWGQPADPIGSRPGYEIIKLPSDVDRNEGKVKSKRKVQVGDYLTFWAGRQDLWVSGGTGVHVNAWIEYWVLG